MIVNKLRIEGPHSFRWLAVKIETLKKAITLLLLGQNSVNFYSRSRLSFLMLSNKLRIEDLDV